ncbi:hypothetical protein GCM10022243_59710 [Saccharothrix violaceirubra]
MVDSAAADHNTRNSGTANAARKPVPNAPPPKSAVDRGRHGTSSGTARAGYPPIPGAAEIHTLPSTAATTSGGADSGDPAS